MLMKSFPLRTKNGQVVGFEISHSFISSGGIARFVSRVPGTEISSQRRWFSAEEIHVKFFYSGINFIVWEPYGDNSRLTVVPDEGEPAPEETIAELRAEFEATPRWALSV